MITSAISSAIQEENSTFSTSTITRRRKINREQIASCVRNQFDNNDCPFFFVHWDSKIMSNTTNDNSSILSLKIDRLSIIVSGINTEKLLTVSKLPSATGEQQAKAVCDAIHDWNLLSKIAGIFFFLLS